MTTAPSLRIARLQPPDRVLAKDLFALMAHVFEEETAVLSDVHVDRLLASDAFFAVAALRDGAPVGGLVAHALPMTRVEARELFIYDIAVRADVQRQGIGRALMSFLRREAQAQGIGLMFVPADNDDAHALDFYRALGGEESPVTFFTFGPTGAG